jgi:hypothetical protein
MLIKSNEKFVKKFKMPVVYYDLCISFKLNKEQDLNDPVDWIMGEDCTYGKNKKRASAFKKLKLLEPDTGYNLMTYERDLTFFGCTEEQMQYLINTYKDSPFRITYLGCQTEDCC